MFDFFCLGGAHNLHFYQLLPWCCWSRNHTLRTSGLEQAKKTKRSCQRGLRNPRRIGCLETWEYFIKKGRESTGLYCWGSYFAWSRFFFSCQAFTVIHTQPLTYLLNFSSGYFLTILFAPATTCPTPCCSLIESCNCLSLCLCLCYPSS